VYKIIGTTTGRSEKCIQNFGRSIQILWKCGEVQVFGNNSNKSKLYS